MKFRLLFFLLKNPKTIYYGIISLQRPKMGRGKQMAIIRKEKKYSVNEVLEQVIEKGGAPVRIDFDGNTVCINSDKLITFKQKGTTCVECQIEGTFFVKEKHITKRGGEYFHLNLYAVDSNGAEVLMTKDHIIPKSSGGFDDISNYQTMCETCNKKKADKISEELKRKKEKTMKKYMKEKSGNYALADALQKALKRD